MGKSVGKWIKVLIRVSNRGQCGVQYQERVVWWLGGADLPILYCCYSGEEKALPTAKRVAARTMKARTIWSNVLFK